MARPAYKPTKAHIQRAYQGARKGLNEEEIARTLKIAYSTFCKHKRKFSGAIKKGRAEGDLLNVVSVENALLKRARGFSYVEEKTEEHWAVASPIDGTKFEEPVLLSRNVTKTTKKVAPDTGAAIFYLTNRYEARWKNKLAKADDDAGEVDNTPVFGYLPDNIAAPAKNE